MMAHTPGPLTTKKGNYICKDDRAIGIAFNLRITEFGQSILPGRDNARLWAAAPAMEGLLLRIRDYMADGPSLTEADFIDEIDELLGHTQ